MLREQESSRVGKMADPMIGIAKSLLRDLWVESILRNRKARLGFPTMTERRIRQSLADMVGMGRSRHIGIGM